MAISKTIKCRVNKQGIQHTLNTDAEWKKEQNKANTVVLMFLSFFAGIMFYHLLLG